MGTRVLHFRRAYARAVQRLEDDQYMASVCANAHIRKEMGYHSTACELAESGLHQSPSARALEEVFRTNYLCGDVSCLDVLGRLQLVLVCVCMLVFLFFRNARRSTVLPSHTWNKLAPYQQIHDKHA